VLLTLLTGMGVVTPQEARVLLSMGSQWRSRPGVAAHQEARQALLAASQKLAQVSR
jgi:predicted DNA-binding transcriptional regulator YafY